ncbi:hypothetical protein DSO57_1035558 [Entomophthora muscae]|uniref:Uncharacterized protein n=1 Tax=Entomophthora muscae TaxID=34485 RepID=A0ACC2U8I3_9FUNG|nr:hypothetical protein DSO57_1035558 [Entomophthora muscae]
MTIEASSQTTTVSPKKQPYKNAKGVNSLKADGVAGTHIKVNVNPDGSISCKPTSQIKSNVSNDEDEEITSDEDEENFPYIQREVHVECPFSNCPNAGEVFTNPTHLPPHLRLHHRLYFRNLYHMTSVLQAYLSHWAERLEKQSAESFLPTQEDESGKFYVIGPETFPEDENTRRNLQQEKLKEILAFQDQERQEVAKKPHDCLFCCTVAEDRAALFKHMFSEHGFNIGLPDNLVYTEEFLTLLRNKLADDVCLYCDKVFKSSKVLRMHMRKKKHFRIHSRNHTYDKFYVINYAEPGKTWDVLEKEKEADLKQQNQERDIDDVQNSWDEWDDKESEITLSLFDSCPFDSPAAALAHDKQKYGFDLEGTIAALGLDFYKSVTLVNYVRHQTSQGLCISCHTKESDLPGHYASKNCLEKLTISLEDSLWNDPTYLVPTIENDPLLMYLDDPVEIEPEYTAIAEKLQPGLDPAQKLIYAQAADLASGSK